jgi:hypothetical protein
MYLAAIAGAVTAGRCVVALGWVVVMLFFGGVEDAPNCLSPARLLGVELALDGAI